jgi:hypothetical protein
MFRDAKVGDRIWNVVQGWGEVIQIDNDPIYPLGIQFENGITEKFTLDGKGNRRDKYPCLYWDEIQITPPPKPKRKVKRTVEGWVNPKNIDGKNDFCIWMSSPTKNHVPVTLTYEIEE